jgi:hypothetical protein
LDPTTKAVAYEIEVGIRKGQVVRVSRIQRRYSALAHFDAEIRPLFKKSRFLRPFPPKKTFGNTKPDFVSGRAEKLQIYLTNLLRVTGIVSTPAFLSAFDIDPELLNET